MSKREISVQSRWMMEQELYKLRYMQQGSKLPDSDFFTLIAKIFNLTGGSKESEMILTLVGKLKTRERINRTID